MYVIQSGIVELTNSLDKKGSNTKFIIERLGRGSVINATAFLLSGRSDYKLRAVGGMVSYYSISSQVFAKIAKRFPSFYSEI